MTGANELFLSPDRFVKEKRPTISPNFNFLGQLLDFEKKIKSPESEMTLSVGKASSLLEDLELPSPEAAVGTDITVLEPLTLSCVLADAPDEQSLAQTLSGLQLTDAPEENARLKRSFSLDIKSFGDTGVAPAHRGFTPSSGESSEVYKTSVFKDTSKPCQFSPVEEVSEQSTPEQSPDKEEVETPRPTSSTFVKPPPAAQSCSQQLHRSGSTENATTFLFGLSRSQQHIATGVGGALKGWHSDILLGPVAVSTSSLTGGWYLSSDSTRFYSTSFLSGGGSGSSSYSAYTCGHGLEAIRRRGNRPRTGDCGDSRRSWHEESSFEKQLKRRSCQMEFGDGMKDSRSREELGKVGSQSSFSGSMEVIEVS